MSCQLVGCQGTSDPGLFKQVGAIPDHAGVGAGGDAVDFAVVAEDWLQACGNLLPAVPIQHLVAGDFAQRLDQPGFDEFGNPETVEMRMSPPWPTPRSSTTCWRKSSPLPTHSMGVIVTGVPASASWASHMGLTTVFSQSRPAPAPVPVIVISGTSWAVKSAPENRPSISSMSTRIRSVFVCHRKSFC